MQHKGLEANGCMEIKHGSKQEQKVSPAKRGYGLVLPPPPPTPPLFCLCVSGLRGLLLSWLRGCFLCVCAFCVSGGGGAAARPQPPPTVFWSRLPGYCLSVCVSLPPRLVCLGCGGAFSVCVSLNPPLCACVCVGVCVWVCVCLCLFVSAATLAWIQKNNTWPPRRSFKQKTTWTPPKKNTWPPRRGFKKSTGTNRGDFKKTPGTPRGV